MMPRNLRNFLALAGSFLALSLLAANAFATRSLDFRIYLPLVEKEAAQPTRPGPDPLDAIVNPGFESGQTGWTFYSPPPGSGNDILTPAQSHTGQYSARLGHDAILNRIASIEQAVTVPAGFPVLEYWRWVSSVEVCEEGYDFLTLSINGAALDTTYIGDCLAKNAWERQTVNLSAYAGQAVVLKLRFESDISLLSDVYVDDFAFVSP